MDEILGYLKHDDIRITNDHKDRWMVFDDNGCWVVLERKTYKRNSTILYSGESWHDAFRILLSE
jgi:hypothetical protein